MVHKSRFTRSVRSTAVLGAAIVLFLGGCGGIARGAAFQPTGTAPPPTATTTPSAVGNAFMAPQPNGSAELTWDPGNDHTLTVALSLAGLAPMNPGSYPSAPYPATLGSGDCQHQGSMLHQLAAVTADRYGAGSSATTIKGIAGGIPARDWYIALHAPAAGNQGASLACANVINPKPSTTEKQSVKARLRGVPHEQGGEGAHGKARLSLSGTTLTVTLSLVGLAPGSHHDAHIHSGSCAKQGPVVHPLETVVADSSGRAQVVTTIQGVQAISDNWYIHVHNGTDLKTQAGYQPIACGDVFVRS